MVDDDSLHAEERESELLASKEIRNVSFPGSVRGYDRNAVDAYVKRVNRVIAELEMSSSPRTAVRHALEQVGEQTSGILQQARESAEEIIASARQEAEETITRAKSEAAETVVDASTQADRAKVEAEQLIAKAMAEAEGIVTEAKAEAEKVLARTREEAAARQEESEARLRELHAEIAITWKERRELLDDVRGIATRLQEAASEAAARTAPEGADELPEGATLELEFEPARQAEGATTEVTEAEADPAERSS